MAVFEVRQTKIQPVTAQSLFLRRVAPAALHPTIYWTVPLLVILDVACIILSMVLAFQLRFRVMGYYAPVSTSYYFQLAFVAIVVEVVLFVSHRLYHVDRLFGGLGEYANVFNASTISLVGLILYSFMDRRADSEISRGWLAMVWLFSVASLELHRFLFRRVIYWFRQKGLLCRRALIVGANAEGREIAVQLRASRTAGVEVVGFVDPHWEPGLDVAGVPVLGTVARLEALVRCLKIEDLVFIPSALPREELLDLYRDWSTDDKVRVLLSSGLYELFTTGVQVNNIGFTPLVSLNRTRITGIDAIMKGLLDYVGAGLGILFLSPVFLVLALLVRLDSKGPAIYRRRVVGLGGKEFDAYKFRTMITDAEDYLNAHPELKVQWEVEGKIQDDPRITRVGRFLRRYSLDELPQLFNVVRGEMSLVGPRMITRAEMDRFGRWQHNRATVKPGLTGLWQISGRSDLSYADRVRLDMQYIRNYTIWTDLKTLLGTVKVVLKGRGAY